MGLLDIISFKGTSPAYSNEHLPDIFQFLTAEKDFVYTDVLTIYQRILTDVIERTQGISKEIEPLLWDSCLKSEVNEGLITMVSKAMVDKSELCLVYDKALKVVIHADDTQKRQIEADYKKSGKSDFGVFVSFTSYKTTDMMRIYSALEYCSIVSLNKTMNVSKAIQIKIEGLRGSVSLTDSSSAKAQAFQIADALSKGKDVYGDAKDSIETTIPDITATQTTMDFIAQKQSFYLGLPAAYITGLARSGLGDTGEGDAKAIERGLKHYFASIISPIVTSLFKLNEVTFKTDDYKAVASNLEVLKTFDLVSEEFISKENKTKLVNQVFNLDQDAKGDEVTEPTPLPPLPKNDIGF